MPGVAELGVALGPGLGIALRRGLGLESGRGGDDPVTVTGLGLGSGGRDDEPVTVNSALCVTLPALLVMLEKVILAE
jgi:hypothetical protein